MNKKLIISILILSLVGVGFYFMSQSSSNIQGRMALREAVPEVSIDNTRERDSFEREFNFRDNANVNYVTPISTVTAKVYSSEDCYGSSKGGSSLDACGSFKLAVCAPNDLGSVNLTYKSIGGLQGGLVYSKIKPIPKTETGYDPENPFIKQYKLVNDFSLSRHQNFYDKSAIIPKLSEQTASSYALNLSSCEGGVEWILPVNNSYMVGSTAFSVPYYVGHVVVYVDSYDLSGEKLGDTVIVSHDVPMPKNAIIVD